MTQREKAEKLMDAATKAAAEYRSEGNLELSNLVQNSFAALPEESAARLYDFITSRP